MGAFFGFDYPEPYSTYSDVAQIYDDHSHGFINAEPDCRVYPVFQGLPMGWSWSLFLCNLVTLDCLRHGVANALQLPLADVPVA
eukprot:2810701-Amphidinium_carterae.1